MSEQPSAQQGQEPGGDTAAPEVIPRGEYEKVLQQLETSKSFQEKAELLDELLEDPEFQAFVRGEQAPPTAQPRRATAPAPSAPKISPELQVALDAIQELRQDIQGMKEIYNGDKETQNLAAAEAQIDAMEKDKANFPFFDKVKNEMADLLTNGRAVNLADAYKMAAFDYAKAHGREEASRKKDKGPPAVGPKGQEPGGKPRKPFEQGKKSLRDALDKAFDKHSGGVPDDEED